MFVHHETRLLRSGSCKCLNVRFEEASFNHRHVTDGQLLMWSDHEWFVTWSAIPIQGRGWRWRFAQYCRSPKLYESATFPNDFNFQILQNCGSSRHAGNSQSLPLDSKDSWWHQDILMYEITDWLIVWLKPLPTVTLYQYRLIPHCPEAQRPLFDQHLDNTLSALNFALISIRE